MSFSSNLAKRWSEKGGVFRKARLEFQFGHSLDLSARANVWTSPGTVWSCVCCWDLPTLESCPWRKWGSENNFMQKTLTLLQWLWNSTKCPQWGSGELSCENQSSSTITGRWYQLTVKVATQMPIHRRIGGCVVAYFSSGIIYSHEKRQFTSARTT